MVASRHLPGQPAPHGQVLGVDHVQLAMPPGDDAERAAVAFYGDVLGLTRVPQPPELAVRGGCWFESPYVKLHLGVDDPFVPARKAHPALVVDDLDEIAKQIELVAADDLPEVRRGHCFDPFGNRIELIELGDPTGEMFRIVAEQSLFPITLLDDEGVVRWVGGSYERIFGWQPDELIGHGFDRVIAPQSLDAAVEAFAHVDEAYEQAPWGGVGLQVDLLHADGTCVPCEIAAVTRKRSGLPWYLVFARQAGYERALDQAVEAMASGSSSHTPRGVGEVLTIVVEALERMVPEATIVVGDRWSGESFDVTAGRAATLLQPHAMSPWARAMQSGADQHADCDDLPAPLASLARAEGFAACWVHPISVGADDEPEAAVIAWRPFAGPPQHFSRLTINRGGQLLRLVLQWDRSQRMLEFAATHDPLTGLANRQSFRDRLATVSRAREGTAAVLYLDLDRFKPVNDVLGHAAGDRVLMTVAERLVTALRPGDMVARMGGDEFAVLCERLTKPDDVERVADRLLTTIRQPITQVPGGEITIDASIGIADVAGGERVDAVLARADDAMRTAKRRAAGSRAGWTR